jgi:ATP-dependent helicase/nuclease subunit A
MSSANPEQLLAIEHNGGVLLKAGAGSGKTFVLKEHIIYLTSNWIVEFRQILRQQDFAQFIKAKFREIVMMTFTKKAAGEISIRLHKEFENKILSVSIADQPFWVIAKEQLSYLTVTTIHGFCFQLIKQGFFTEIDLDKEIMTDAQFDDTMESLFEKWMQEHLEKEQDKSFVDLVIRDRTNIFQSIKGIFADPSLRTMWLKSTSINNLEINADQATQELISLLQLNKFETFNVDLNQLTKLKGKAWFDFLIDFESFKRPLNNVNDVVSYYDYFKNRDFKIPSTPRGKDVDDDLRDYYISIKDLKDFVKDVGEDFVRFEAQQNNLVLSWFNKYNEIIHYIHKAYKKAPGITFADLEFVVATGLEDAKIAKEVSESYRYLIVDEFQDTSFIQFEIISKVIQHDFNRLFCVGDIKQAIYGFRGGELAVFLKAQSLVPRVLSLTNNYRSDQKVINFNNNFFDFLFRKGLKFEGHDIRPVEVEYQTVPNCERDQGKVYQVKIEANFLKDFGKLEVSTAEIDYLEALGLIHQITHLRKIAPDENVSILYKKLKPSLVLIGLFIQHEIGFTAQVKIPFGEDPILGIFKTLVEYDFNLNENRDQFVYYIIKAYLSILDSGLEIDIVQAVLRFQTEQAYIGIYRAFYNFLQQLSLCNSNYRNNLLHIKTICSLGADNKEKILTIITNEKENSYSLDFQYGKNPDKVVIMTAHASKGLEFDHVLLGGIYTNSKSFPFTSLLGKLPFSFKWGETLTSKQKFKTPQYLLENELNKHKDFSESKRLFYVACTRAEKSLGWVNIELGQIKARLLGGAWSFGFQAWFQENFKDNTVIQSDINRNASQVDVSKEFSIDYLVGLSNRKPLFHIDTLGLTTKTTKSDLFLLPELSVTRLASVADCPRKFYLSNICKLSEADLKLLANEKIHLEKNDDENLGKKSFASSAARGSEIHAAIDALIKNDFKSNEKTQVLSSDLLKWIVDKLSGFREKYRFQSEVPVKFELFKFMLSGIPDLVLLPNENTDEAMIWDYKTGKRNLHKENAYIFQLMAYAYALFHSMNYPKTKMIKLVLCYVDEKEIVEQIVTSMDVENFLKPHWVNTNRPDLQNQNHCKACLFGNICRVGP